MLSGDSDEYYESNASNGGFAGCLDGVQMTKSGHGNAIVGLSHDVNSNPSLSIGQ